MVSSLANLQHRLMPVAKKMGLEFKIQINEDVTASLNGDQNHLRQVEINLASSAIKSTDCASVMVSVRKLDSANEEDANGSHLANPQIFSPVAPSM